jgi:hypothetical protein
MPVRLAQPSAKPTVYASYLGETGKDGDCLRYKDLNQPMQAIAPSDRRSTGATSR